MVCPPSVLYHEFPHKICLSRMNCVALDNLGIAGFGYNFASLDGNKPEVINVFEAFESPDKADFFARMLFFLSPFFPSVLELPTSTNKMLKGIRRSMKVIADDLIGRMKQEMSMAQDKHTEKSIIGLLSECSLEFSIYPILTAYEVKAESSSTELAMSREEVEAQVRNSH